MNTERWERVQHLLEAALEQPEEKRREFVEAACGGDAELRDEIVSLLDADVVDDLPSPWLGALASPAADRFAPGDRIADRYVIRRLLGRGGMGEVYEADDEELAITVALKTLREAGAGGALELLKLEGLLARAVWHPNVCRVYELDQHATGGPPVWFLAMERLHGVTLEECLCKEGRLPVAHALRVAQQMAAGLAAAHRAGVVHRDLKPSNVMLVQRDGAEQAVVTDFGTGRAVPRTEGARARHGGALVGTPTYMAPEQLRGEDAGPAADIYALGLVLYQMVTGKLPFPDLPAPELLRRKLEADAPSPRLVRPELDVRWDDVIRRCLDPDPRRRFERVEEVAESLAGQVPAHAPDPLTLAGHGRASWPAERDPFVGREADIEELERALTDGATLVTLVGPGGMGKTRLAVRYGWRTAGAWPGGIWFCDLTEARDANGIAAAVAVGLGIQLGRGDSIQQLGHAIAGRGRCLLLLDNFEQVVDRAAETLGHWRKQAPEARFLVTSRERLSLEGERARAVEPLSSEEGVELFAIRARGLRPALELAGVELESAREIVRLVDGIPLAIELAAARVPLMTVPQILERMRKRFRLLTGGSGTRHETLAGAIDGSWDLLTPWERAAWAQCAVFEAGFTLESAEQVLDLSAWPEAPPVVDVIRSLVDKSLLRTWVPPAVPGETLPDVRFGMYVTLQEYARAKLRGMDGGAAAERAAEERHGACFAGLGTDAALDAVDEHGGLVLWRRLEREIENVAAGYRRALARGDGATAVATLRAAWRVHKARGPLGATLELGREALREAFLTEAERAIVAGVLGDAEWFSGRYEDGRKHLEAAAASAGALGDPRLDVKLLPSLGRTYFYLGRTEEAVVCLERAATLARELGDRHALCSALNSLGMVQHEVGRTEKARLLYEESIRAAREIGDRGQEAVGLVGLGILLQKRGLLDEAGDHFEAALAIHRETGNRRSEGIAHVNLGSLRTDQGRGDEARAHVEASLVIAREIGSRHGEGIAWAALGELHMEQGHSEEARASLEAALAIFRDLGDRRVESILIGNLARVHQQRGELAEARAKYETALAIHRELEDRHYEGAALTGLASLLREQGVYAEARAALADAEPILREIRARQEVGLLLCVRAELEQESGNAELARAAHLEAESIAAELGTRPGTELGRALVRVRSRMDLEVKSELR